MLSVNGQTIMNGKNYMRLDDIYKDMPVGLEMTQNPAILIAESSQYDYVEVAKKIEKLCEEENIGGE